MATRFAINHFGRARSVAFYSRAPALFPVEKRIAESSLGAGRKKVLEVGCGAGRVSYHLRETYGHDVHSLDISPELVEAGIRLGHLRRETAIVGDATRLPYLESDFDVVWFSFNGIDCLHPAKARLRFFDEALRTLRPKGLLVFSSHTRRAYYRPRTAVELACLLFNLVRPEWWMRSYFLAPKRNEGLLRVRATDIPEVLRETETSGFRCREIVSDRFSKRPGDPRDELVLASELDPWPHYVFEAAK